MYKNIILLLFVSSHLFAVPTWYLNQEHISEDRVYYGYGKGKTQDKARLNALREISEQIYSNVSSSISIKTKSINSFVSQNIDSETFLSSNKTLKESKIIKTIKDEKNYYILIKYIYTSPVWYEERSFEAPLFNIIGYGEGTSFKSASMHAKEDIAGQISTNIKSTIELLEKDVNSEYTSEVKSKISSSSKAILEHSKYIKSDKIGDKYFVALILQKVPILKCSNSKNDFLNSVQLIKKANSLTSCDYVYSLEHINNSWHLYSDGYSQKLNYSQFDSFFISTGTKLLNISSKYSSYQTDDMFTLNIQSKKAGYLSIIAIYENGKVGILLENKQINKDSNTIFPHPNDDFELYAGLNEKNEETKDLYFAFVSQIKINLSKFQAITDKLLDEKTYRFNDVIKLCNKYNYSTTLIRTTHKTKIKRFNNIEKNITDGGFNWFFTDKLNSALDDLPYKSRNPKKWAFIISIEDYEFSDSVKYASNDGESFKLLAQKKLNIKDEQIIHLNEKNANEKNIIMQLNELKTKVKEGDTIYFYFVGHGIPVPQEKNEPYLLAYDKSVATVSKNKNLKLSNIYKILSSTKASKIFIFLDTTFSGATDGVSIFKGVASPKLKPKKLKINNNKMSVFIAGKDSEFTNMLIRKKHRMFTYYLIDGLVNHKIDNTKYLYHYIKTNVNKSSFELGDDYIQTPILQGNLNAKF